MTATQTQPLMHIPAGQGQLIQVGGFGTVVKVPHEALGGSVSIVEHTLEPGLLGAPLHRHEREDEISYVLQGRLTVQIGEEIATAGPGEIIVKPRGSFHAFWNAGDGPVRFVEVIAPGGFERYFAELPPLVPADGPPDIPGIIALSARYGLEFDFDSMPELLERHGLRLG